MDVKQAKAVLAGQLQIYRTRSYEELKNLIGQVKAYDVKSADGAVYQIEIEVCWDEETNGNIRVIGATDDGGLRAIAPLTDDFIMMPDGAFLGE